MTKSESRARNILKKEYPNAYIWKVADYKQIGNAGNKGLPDYLVISEGKYIWFEVKMIKSLKVFNLNEINENQWAEFCHMFTACADIKILIILKNYKHYCIDFQDCLKFKENAEKSLDLRNYSINYIP